MNARSWFRKIFACSPVSTRRPRKTRLYAEALEGRCVPSIVTLAQFNDLSSGSMPEGALVEDKSGNIFGTTYQGGQFNEGTIFEVPVDSYTVITLASFDGTDGANPTAGV